MRELINICLVFISSKRTYRIIEAWKTTAGSTKPKSSAGASDSARAFEEADGDGWEGSAGRVGSDQSKTLLSRLGVSWLLCEQKSQRWRTG